MPVRDTFVRLVLIGLGVGLFVWLIVRDEPRCAWSRVAPTVWRIDE